MSELTSELRVVGTPPLRAPLLLAASFAVARSGRQRERELEHSAAAHVVANPSAAAGRSATSVSDVNTAAAAPIAVKLRVSYNGWAQLVGITANDEHENDEIPNQWNGKIPRTVLHDTSCSCVSD